MHEHDRTNFHVEIGDSVSFTKTVSESDVYLFAGITGDLAPNHVNAEYMKRSSYGRRMVHGALLVGFMSTTSTMAIEKSRASQEETPVAVDFDRVRFIAPVFIGDTITVTYTVDSIDLSRRRSVANVEITNQEGTLVAVATHILQWVKNS
ncbi:MAG: MaoC/PaaZ C-terminal domain-containing protein [Chloroflexota bacterium]